MNVTLRGVKNPNSTKPPVNSFFIRISTKDGYLIDESYESVMASPDLTPSPLVSYNIEQSSSSIGQK